MFFSAREVARQILQGIKHKLDKEIISPFLIHDVVVSESIPTQIVNTVLDSMSTKGKYEKNIFDREIDPDWPKDVVEKLFNKSDYQNKLQFQILDTIEAILSDICEKTIEENNLPFAASTVKCNVNGSYLEANSEVDPECTNKVIPMLLVPKSCVAIISSDMVNIVLQNLTSAVMLSIHAKDSISLRSPLMFSDEFPEAEHQRPPVTDSVNERKRDRFPFKRKGRYVHLNSAYSDDNQTTVLKNQDIKKSAPDPCEENAHFITKTILNRLKSFVTERIDSIFTLGTQARENPYAGPEFTSCELDDSISLESNQTPSDVNTLNISTAKTILSPEVVSSLEPT